MKCSLLHPVDDAKHVPQISLTSTLFFQVFFSYTCNAAVDGALRKKAEKFKAHLTKKFKWDFDAEPDDCAPVVVELPEGVLTD